MTSRLHQPRYEVGHISRQARPADPPLVSADAQLFAPARSRYRRSLRPRSHRSGPGSVFRGGDRSPLHEISRHSGLQHRDQPVSSFRRAPSRHGPTRTWRRSRLRQRFPDAADRPSWPGFRANATRRGISASMSAEIPQDSLPRALVVARQPRAVGLPAADCCAASRRNRTIAIC